MFGLQQKKKGGYQLGKKLQNLLLYYRLLAYLLTIVRKFPSSIKLNKKHESIIHLPAYGINTIFKQL